MEGQEGGGGEKDRTRKKILAMASLKYVGKKKSSPQGLHKRLGLGDYPRKYCAHGSRKLFRTDNKASLSTFQHAP